MDNETVKDQLHDYADMTERALERYIPERDCLQKNVILAARHSLTAGGKRLRPALVMEFCRVCGGEPESALSVACAIEMMHTFSLIHDDLPCMDNDDMRRGTPSCHKAFGEAGIYGMIGGQVIDTENEGKQLPENVILEMYRMKTGALLEFCCRAGVIAAGGGAELQLAAGTYARKLGLAFQIIDDILDVTADENQLGKPVGSDADSGKYTYAAVVGLDRARAEAARLTDEAVQALEPFADREFLTGLTKLLLDRKY